MNKEILRQLEQVEKISNFSKIRRFIHNPSKYISAIFFRKFIYPKNKADKPVETKLFFGRKMKIALPSSADIYLTGGKSHSSEIRLARYLIHHLKPGSHFLDIGAHFGYFTLLAYELIGDEGKIISFEPASRTFELLKHNTQLLRNVTIHQKAVSDNEEVLTFYEFPNLHSEYNAMDVSQFKDTDWFQDSKPEPSKVQATTIDHMITEDKLFRPDIIKIDVEGAELNVISGGIDFFKRYSPAIVMEYLEPSRKNESHKKAMELLLSLYYNSYIIANDGSLKQLDEIDNYLIENKLESDNIVFVKSI